MTPCAQGRKHVIHNSLIFKRFNFKQLQNACLTLLNFAVLWGIGIYKIIYI